ncbi:ankyrin repeat protein [Catovirus CTV1]|uniref:Ankyrin repeat protein n=1 Tax=Catovirus CTV1 TaxID=1977631 RepID=A0A1V0SBW1_9VIRU|nr:ankyrin repeat protein [Catovirus CTV1]
MTTSEKDNFIKSLKENKFDMIKTRLLEENFIKNSDKRKKKTDDMIISVYDHTDLFNYLKPKEVLQNFIKDLGYDKIENGTVLSGRFLLNIFDKEKNFNINDKFCLSLHKKHQYDSLVHFLLKQEKWQDRIAYEKGKVFVSFTFVLGYLERIKFVKQHDPVLNKNYCIFNSVEEKTMHQLIESYDYYGLLQKPVKNYEDICDNMTPIERTLLMFSKEENIVLKNELKRIAHILSIHRYVRSPHIYFNFLGIEDEELKLIIYSIDNKLNLDKQSSKNLEEINKTIINHFIENNVNECLIEFLDLYKYEFDFSDCQNIVKFNSRNLLEVLIKNKKIKNDDALYCILMTEAIDMIQYLQIDNLVNVAKLLIKDIIAENKYVSFFYLYKLDNSIINIKFEKNNSIIHNLSNNSKEILKLILNLNPTIINHCNDSEQNILMTNIDMNIDIIMTIIQTINLNDRDIDGNHILHYIVKHNRIDILKYLLNNKKYVFDLNIMNKNHETPLIMSAITKNEDMLHILFNMGAKDDLEDENGNTVYHYICKNKLCIGMGVKNTVNKFGFYVEDYASISKSHWKWI